MQIPYFSYARFHTAGYVPWHQHSGTEIIFVTRGFCEIATESGLFRIGENDLFVIPAGMKHNQADGDGEENYYFVFRAEEALFSSRCRLLVHYGTEELKSLCEAMFRKTDEGGGIGAEGLLCSFLLLLSHAENTEEGFFSSFPSKLNVALQFVRDHFQEPVIAEDIARHCGVCPGYLRTLFQKYLKESPITHLNGARLLYAKKLLVDPTLSIKEIAPACGIPDKNYFIRLYKKKFGTTPGKDRA